MVPTYPIWFDPATFSRVEFPFFAGGIEVTEVKHKEFPHKFFLKKFNF